MRNPRLVHVLGDSVSQGVWMSREVSRQQLAKFFGYLICSHAAHLLQELAIHSLSIEGRVDVLIWPLRQLQVERGPECGGVQRCPADLFLASPAPTAEE